MTRALALGGPIVTAAAGLTLRRRLGAWASWLLFLAAGAGQAWFLSTPPWWTEPNYLAGLAEAVGLLAAALVMALATHQVRGEGRYRALQVLAIAAFGMLVEWANARFDPSARTTTLFLVLCGVWLIGLLARDWQQYRSRRRS
jgi:hypothetical protein